MSAVDDVKSRLDIVEYIGKTVPLKKAGRYYKANCPFHNERTPSFVVNQDTQSWRCFGACAEGGDIFSFAMKRHGWTFNEALTELATLAGVELAPQSPEQKQHHESTERLRGLLATIAEVYHQHLLSDDPLAVEALRYVRQKRGLTDETIEAFGIGFAPPGWQVALDHLTQLGYSEADVIDAGIATRNDAGKVYDRFRNRLMIPIRDERGRVIGFGARALAPDDNPKYLNSPQTALFDKSRVLFGLDLAGRSIRETETAVIVEGYMDAIQAHQAGFSNVVAQMGTAMTEAQLKRIAPRWAKKIVLALDADPAGQSATLRGLEVAREALQADYGGRLAVDIRILAIPDAKDPDDLIRESPERWAELVSNATPVADYVIAAETSALAPNATVQEREALARRVLPILIASENDLYKKDNLQKLALRLRIAERDLLAWADEQMRVTTARPPRMEKRAKPDMLDAPATGPSEPASAPLRPAPPPEPELEKYCLRVLLENPDLLRVINRKFRELAGDRQDLTQGPLADLSGEDFSRSDYRAVVALIEAALDQDELEPWDYIETTMDAHLRPLVESLRVPDDVTLRNRVGDRLQADLTASMKLTWRLAMPTNLEAEATEKALKLRKQRLLRERQEIGFLQADAQSGHDNPGEAVTFDHRILLSNIAEQRIDAEIARQSRLIRQV